MEDLFLKWKYKRLKQRVARDGVQLTGRVENIQTTFAVPMQALQGGAKPDLRPHIIVSYRTPDGRDQKMSLRTDKVSEFEPVGRDVRVRYLNDKGRDIAFPEFMFDKEEE
jgi:hypothetical protein